MDWDDLDGNAANAEDSENSEEDSNKNLYFCFIFVFDVCFVFVQNIFKGIERDKQNFLKQCLFRVV